eukprot:1282335-Pyramimonas_sp.AAC.1
MAHACSRSSQKGTCATTAIRLTYGDGRDPVQVYFKRLLQAWLTRLAHRPHLLERVRVCWEASLAVAGKGW